MQATLWQLGDIKAEDIMDVKLSSIFDHRDDPQKLLFIIQDDLVLLGKQLEHVREGVFLANAPNQNLFHFGVEDLLWGAHVLLIEVDLSLFVGHFRDAHSLFDQVYREQQSGHFSNA